MTATSIVDPEEVAATLEAAADYIDEHGWCQGGSTGRRKRGHLQPTACVVGAIGQLAFSKGLNWKPLVYGVATRAVRSEVGAIGEWNDTPGREEWEVTELLRSTAKKVRHGDLGLS